jgi:hypothetical protein
MIIEETRRWISEHRAAGRELETLASELRLKTLERCQQKKNKPEFINKLLEKAEYNVWQFSVKAETRHYRPENDQFLDDALLNVVVSQAIKDFKMEHGLT